MTCYVNWGFRGNPFSTRALSADRDGEQLLVGRTSEITDITRRLFARPKCVTVEGPVGVGKTSIINVAAYKAFNSFLAGNCQEMLIPCNQIFQLSDNEDSDAFSNQVLTAIAQTLIKESNNLKDHGYTATSDVAAINRWLNSPQLTTWQAGLPFGSIGQSMETNTSVGFSNSGLRRFVSQWIEELFPDGEGGGIICVIDNLELLRDSSSARQRIEELRDTLLTLNGVRWVLCGDVGVVRGVASSPRLSAILHRPLEVNPIDNSFSGEIVKARVNTLAIDSSNYYLPFLFSDFDKLYGVLGFNLREALSFIDEYCQVVGFEASSPQSDTDKSVRFNDWLYKEALSVHDAVVPNIGLRAWNFFVKVLDANREFSPSEFQSFGFNTQQAMRAAVVQLETQGLLRVVQDVNDIRRRTIQLSSKGYLVAYVLEAMK